MRLVESKGDIEKIHKISKILFVVLKNEESKCVSEMIEADELEVAYEMAIFRGRIRSEKPSALFSKHYKK